MRRPPGPEGPLAAEEIPPLVSHLLEADSAASHLHVLRCSACRAAVLSHLPRTDAYEEVLDRIEASAAGLADRFLRERSEAPALWEELRDLSMEDRSEKIATDPRYQMMALAELLEAAGETARPAAVTEQLLRSLASGSFEQTVLREVMERLTEVLLHDQP